jgi:hypothetical protein
LAIFIEPYDFAAVKIAVAVTYLLSVDVWIGGTVDDINPAPGKRADQADQRAFFDKDGGTLFGFIIVRTRKREKSESPEDERKHRPQLQNNREVTFLILLQMQSLCKRGAAV